MQQCNHSVVYDGGGHSYVCMKQDVGLLSGYQILGLTAG